MKVTDTKLFFKNKAYFFFDTLSMVGHMSIRTNEDTISDKYDISRFGTINELKKVVNLYETDYSTDSYYLFKSEKLSERALKVLDNLFNTTLDRNDDYYIEIKVFKENISNELFNNYIKVIGDYLK